MKRFFGATTTREEGPLEEASTVEKPNYQSTKENDVFEKSIRNLASTGCSQCIFPKKYYHISFKNTIKFLHGRWKPSLATRTILWGRCSTRGTTSRQWISGSDQSTHVWLGLLGNWEQRASNSVGDCLFGLFCGSVSLKGKTRPQTRKKSFSLHASTCRCYPIAGATFTQEGKARKKMKLPSFFCEHDVWLANRIFATETGRK